MAISCCCGANLSREEKCTCDWEGWINLEKERILPDKDGVYLVRVTNNGGDSYEEEVNFRKSGYERYGLGNKVIIFYWECESWDDNCVYAWKKQASEEA